MVSTLQNCDYAAGIEQFNRCGHGAGLFSPLDGNVPWNPARFLNHSCDPNCEAEPDGGRVWIVARRGIRAGEEITFNYGYDLQDYREHPCRCGAADCVGYIVAAEFFEHVKWQRRLTPAAATFNPRI
jgi:hypothetical protein